MRKTFNLSYHNAYEKSIDPQYCMSWVEQHSNEIPNWSAISKVSLEWVNEHTSTGSPINIHEI